MKTIRELIKITPEDFNLAEREAQKFALSPFKNAERKSKALVAVLAKANLFYTTAMTLLSEKGDSNRKEALKFKTLLEQQVSVIAKFMRTKLDTMERDCIPYSRILLRKYLNITGKHPLIQMEQGTKLIAAKDWSFFTIGQEVTVEDISSTPAGISLHFSGSRIPVEVVEDNFGIKGIITEKDLLTEQLALISTAEVFKSPIEK